MTRPAGLVGRNIAGADEAVPPPGDSLRALEALSSGALDPFFWRAERLGTPSAWWQHVPFAHWVVGATSPRTLVELGTYNGVSYSAFCHAVEHNGLDTRCYAVDHWRGDPHAGEYGDDVLADLRQYHDDRYGAFSTLLRFAFDEALDLFPDASIDLLHIDGFHSYDAVSHDFASWRPKLSDRAVVLFHDTNELGADFGVWRLWSELRQRHPSFEFLHGHGLGVLAVGTHVPPAIAGLCGITDAGEVGAIRLRLARLGERWESDALRLHEAAQARAEAAQARAEAAQARAEVVAAREQLQAIYQSTSWRVLEPARRLGGRHPRLARLVRRGLKLVWWTVSLQLVRRLRERRLATIAGSSAHPIAPKPRPQRRKFDRQLIARGRTYLRDYGWWATRRRVSVWLRTSNHRPLLGDGVPSYPATPAPVTLPPQPFAEAATRAGVYRLTETHKNIEDLIRAADPKGAGLRIDLGCGFSKPPGFIGFDNLEGRAAQIEDRARAPDVLIDLNRNALPLANNSCQEVRSSHYLEHSNLDHIISEAFRVLKPNGIFIFTVPYANSADGMFPGHAIFLTEKFFYENLLFQNLFKIVREDYKKSHEYEQLPTAVKKLFPFETARKMLYNACIEMTITAVPKK